MTRKHQNSQDLEFGQGPNAGKKTKTLYYFRAFSMSRRVTDADERVSLGAGFLVLGGIHTEGTRNSGEAKAAEFEKNPNVHRIE